MTRHLMTRLTIAIMGFNLIALAFFGLVTYKEYKIEKSSASDYVSIEYIKASDVKNYVQYFEMCRWVDKVRTGKWTWELTSVENGRVFSNSVDAVMEVKEDCIVEWVVQKTESLEQMPGEYYWEAVVTFDVKGHKKSITKRSNVFYIYD